MDLIDVLASRGVRPQGVIHVGAHHGQEHAAYQRLGTAARVYIEPQPDAFARLQDAIAGDPASFAFNTACGAAGGRSVMHRLSGNDGASSSLLEPSLHLERWPEAVPAGRIEVPVTTLDEIVRSLPRGVGPFDLLVLDVQGYELEVLRGASSTIASAQAILSEVAAAPLYHGACTVRDLDRYLGDRGLCRVVTSWSAGCAGDALYLRRSVLSILERTRLALIGGRHSRPPRSARTWLRSVNPPVNPH